MEYIVEKWVQQQSVLLKVSSARQIEIGHLLNPTIISQSQPNLPH